MFRTVTHLWTQDNERLGDYRGAGSSMKGTATGSDLFTEVTACLDGLGLKWDKIGMLIK